MDYFYERNIVEIKNEYTTFLTNIITPFIYEGIRSVYSFALNAHNEFLERGKHDPDVKSPGILKMFQLSLKEIPTLNNHSIELEANRIKSGSKCADWFDDLVRAVIKSNIVLLTFNNPKKRSALLKEEYHNKIEIKDFLHKCYIESARLIYNNPELYWHEFSPLEIKRNQREACDLIKQAIHEAVRKMLPIKLILKEYLTNEYLDDENDVTNRISNSDYMNIHSMVQRDLHGNVPGRIPVPIKSALLSEDEEKEMDGGQKEKEEDYTASSNSSSSSSDSSTTSNQTGQQEATGGESDNDFQKIKESLKKLDNFNQVPKPENSPKDIQVNQPNGLSKDEPNIEVPNDLSKNIVVKNEGEKEQNGGKISQLSGVPRAEHDNEIKELLKKNNNMTGTIEKPKKLSKREKNLINELEAQIKPKGPEPDRKIFFEQYMK